MGWAARAKQSRGALRLDKSRGASVSDEPTGTAAPLAQWTPFIKVPTTPYPLATYDRDLQPNAIYTNSLYKVTEWYDLQPEPWGAIKHLMIETHDRAAVHDWRDLQRIKNEICGPEQDAVEIYPAEHKLVDAGNQYHLFVFGSLKLPFGFQSRYVVERQDDLQQRPFAPGERPADCLMGKEHRAFLAAVHLLALQAKSTNK